MTELDVHSHVLTAGCSDTHEIGACAVTGKLHKEVAQIPMTVTLVTLLYDSQQSPTVSWIVPRG